jgi:hypothetical protein
VVREGVGTGGEMTQALYAHMNNKIKKKRKENWLANSKKNIFILLNVHVYLNVCVYYGF